MIKQNWIILIVLSALLVLCQADSPARTSSFDYVTNAGSEEISENPHYLLITNNDLATAFQPLVNRRINQGYSGDIITVESIDATYSGMDMQEKIRNCVREHYDPCTPLFVSLGGDDAVVAVRYAIARADLGTPTDLYYADVDGGSWDSDGNTFWWPWR